MGTGTGAQPDWMGWGLLWGLPGKRSLSGTAALCPAGLTLVCGVASDRGSWPGLPVAVYLE